MIHKKKSHTSHKTSVKRKPKLDEVNEASDESFPCSDPPAWIYEKPKKNKKQK